MVCCEAGCTYTSVYMDRCARHAIEYRVAQPTMARRYDEETARDENKSANAYGKPLFKRLKEARHG